MAPWFCCSLLCYCGFLKPFWPWSHLKLLFVFKTLIPRWKDEREISLPDSLRSRLFLAVTVMTWMSRMPYTLSQIRRRSQSQCANAFLRYQGRRLDGKRLVDLRPKLELVGLVMTLLEVGSGRMCSETPFGVFKEQYTVPCCSATPQRIGWLWPYQGFCEAGEWSWISIALWIGGFILNWKIIRATMSSMSKGEPGGSLVFEGVQMVCFMDSHLNV